MPDTGLNGKLRVSIGVEGVTQSRATSRSYVLVIDVVETTANHVFLYLGYLGPRAACIVPRRAFSSDEAFAKFVETAQNYCEAAKVATDAVGRLWQPPPSTDVQAAGDPREPDPVEGVMAKKQLPDETEPRP